ncbi:hypothetical protein TSUD_357730 [Trifolium subterraneum]|uniref:Uncharacterized protein n=1 Tax=Trifolium subterraneum TaxID=3900 RepID=A0A2Z6NGK1_TRISU|nr:hypothetical protein TSUD_357730 [Trifolium subterraneum]
MSSFIHSSELATKPFSPSCKFLCPQGLQSSSTITLTGQNLTDLLAPDLDEGVLLKQDLEKEETDEHVEVFVNHRMILNQMMKIHQLNLILKKMNLNAWKFDFSSSTLFIFLIVVVVVDFDVDISL